MWITQLLGIRSGHSLGSHAWILIAIFQLAMDFIICESGSPGKAYKHLQRPSLVHRTHKVALWSPKEMLKLRNQKHYWNPINYERSVLPIERKHYKTYHKDHANIIFSRNVPLKNSIMENSHYSSEQIKSTVKMTNLNRSKRQLQSWDNLKRFLDSESQLTTVSEFILWGPTGDDDVVVSSTFPGIYETTKTSTVQARTTLLETTTTTIASTTTNVKVTTLQNPGIHRKKAPGRISTADPNPGNGKTARPPRIPNESSGLAVHQIITITVSLIMVIAALITTLVLKNCCAQSGNARRNNHQRKINQQEESCQNLTDFTPASVPSNMDIFTAYNETLHCSHECIRTPVPVYTDEALYQTGAFKTTFNGNRPTSSDRHLIPVAFVSEKWFEISC
ncbi:adherens junction-associated protein 1 isoform X2 [Xenopus laevis]|uniref:Adherens junction-associated protein 1 isoform X2 n=1 Tax=Xenopus laevis TaxID=8355 RepID=A0A8J1LEH6_XENLA|nr:adherens junction-associated protein 1 isoform X2 [Xenopus laevis]